MVIRHGEKGHRDGSCFDPKCTWVGPPIIMPLSAIHPFNSIVWSLGEVPVGCGPGGIAAATAGSVSAAIAAPTSSKRGWE